MRLAPPLAILFLAAALLAGCGGSGSDSTAQKQPQARAQNAPAGATARSCKKVELKNAEKLRATNISCAEARDLVTSWQKSVACSPPNGASRSSCELKGSYRCLSANTGRGLSVSCAQRGRSVAFIVRRD